MGLDEDASCWWGGGVIWKPLYPFKNGKVNICAVYGILVLIMIVTCIHCLFSL